LVEGELQFRDGAYGLAIGVLLTALIVASGAAGTLRTAIEATPPLPGRRPLAGRKIP
jgi:hypothetical protein